MLIKGEKVFLELMELTDAQTVREWLNEIEVRRLCFAECPLPVDITTAENWIKAMNNDPQSSLLSVRRIQERDLIGFITVRKLSWISRSVRFGSLIWPPDLWNHGLGTDARKAFLSYAFSQLGMERVYGGFGSYNIASKKSHQKLGAEITAITRESVFIDGQFFDVHHYAYQKENFSPSQFSEPPFPNPNKDQSVMLAKDIQRLYQDFYGLSPHNLEEWMKNKIKIRNGFGAIVFLVDNIRKNADLLLFPDKLSVDNPELSDLFKQAVIEGFTFLNLHRIQVCLPSTASSWKERMESLGFIYEGHLDKILYSNGRYYGLCFLGLLRPEFRI